MLNHSREKSATKGLKQPAATKVCNRGRKGAPRQHRVSIHSQYLTCVYFFSVLASSSKLQLSVQTSVFQSTEGVVFAKFSLCIPKNVQRKTEDELEVYLNEVPASTLHEHPTKARCFEPQGTPGYLTAQSMSRV